MPAIAAILANSDCIEGATEVAVCSGCGGGGVRGPKRGQRFQNSSSGKQQIKLYQESQEESLDLEVALDAAAYRP